MKQTNKERRVINIDKDVFDKIKVHCEANCLKMTKWMTEIAIQKLKEAEAKRLKL